MNLADLIIYKDYQIIALNKPAGIPVHSGSSKVDSLENYFSQLCFDKPEVPSLAHRLDADTSGILILGRQKKALRKLGILFQESKIEKTYLAIVEKCPAQPEGIIDLPLYKKNSKEHGWKMIVEKKKGQPSTSHYKVLQKFDDGKALIELKPKTGRTHQLRVHCQAMGWPIVGDNLYGTAKKRENLLLHSYKIKIPLYATKPAIEIKAKIPEHFNLKNIF